MSRLVRMYINRWTPELERIKTDAPALQEEVLHQILATRYITYFHGAVSPDSFSRLSITTYEDYRSKVDQLIIDNTLGCQFFAQSSGTTSGVKKLIPTPETFVRQSHLRGSWYVIHTLYDHNANASVFKFKNLLVGGSIYQRHRGHMIADVSGIMLHRIPQYMRPWYVPSIKIATMPEWEEKIALTANAAAETDNISLLGGLPTWMLSVCRQSLAHTGADKISDLWPQLMAYIHGGVSFDPYRSQFEDLIDIPGFRYLEVYNATEGFFAYQDRPEKEGMLLMCAAGIYYEFIDYEDYKEDNYNIIGIGDVAPDTQYVMVITTSAGLLRYIQGDVVTFVTTAPYRVKVVGRITEYINAFGEDLIRTHVEQAISEVSKEYGVDIRDYTIAPHFITISEKGWHDWYIEFIDPPDDLSRYTAALDKALRGYNNNYDQKRTGDLALLPLRINVLPTGTIDKYFRSKGKIGGQSKLPKMKNDRKLLEQLDAIVEL